MTDSQDTGTAPTAADEAPAEAPAAPAATATDAATAAAPVEGNPVAPAPAGARTAADVVTPEVVARLTRGVVGGGRTANHTPFTGEKLADLPESTPEDVATAFERARAAQERWAKVPVKQRAAVLLRFHDLVLRRQAEVLDLIQLETGKARLHAHEEVQAVTVTARHYGRKAHAYLKPKARTGVVPTLTKVTELRQPRGVVGQIAPWNYPFELSVGDALPAFVAGNAVVMKPDTETALTALWAREQLIEAGLPEDVWQVVLGEGPVVGPAVVEHADYVSFTGSTRTGREVAQGAAARLVGVSLELGGKNAMLVLQDADVEKAASGAVRGCFSSAGQLCISIERLYVHESIADDFLQRFAARTKAMRLGNSSHTAPTWARWSASASWRPSPAMSRRPSPRAPSWSPAAAPAPTSARSSTSRPSSTASRPRWRSAARRPSARSSPSTASATRTRRWRSPTPRRTA